MSRAVGFYRKNGRTRPITKRRTAKRVRFTDVNVDRRERENGAKYQVEDMRTGILWVWYGGHGVHGYDMRDPSQKEIEFFTVREDNLGSVRKGIAAWIRTTRNKGYTDEYGNKRTQHTAKTRRGKRYYSVIYYRDGVSSIEGNHLTLAEAKKLETETRENIAYGDVQITREM